MLPRRLRTIILSTGLAVLGTAGSASAQSMDDDALGRLMQDRGFLDRLDDVSQHVRSAASDMVVSAMAFLGVPYRRGGNSAESGFDCSGFVKALAEQTLGLVLPRRADQQAAATQKIDRGDLQPGDLVFFNTMRRAFSHVGIYVGDGKFIHSPKPGAEVRVEDMRGNYWQHRFNGARRLVTPEPAATLGTDSASTLR